MRGHHIAKGDRLAYAADHSARLRDALRQTGGNWRRAHKAAMRAQGLAANTASDRGSE